MSRNQRRLWMIQKRLEKNLTQTELAKRLQISNRTISEIERGKRNPSGKLALKLATELEVGMEKFFEDEIA